MIVLELPFPPSLNTYWRRARGRVYINEKGRLTGVRWQPTSDDTS